METRLAARNDAFLINALAVRPCFDIGRTVDIVIAAMFCRVFFACILIYVIIFTACVDDALGVLTVHFKGIGNIARLVAVAAVLDIRRGIDTRIGTECIGSVALT